MQMKQNRNNFLMSDKLLIAHLVCSSNIMLFLIQSPYSKAENNCIVEHSKIWFILGPYCNLTCQTIRKISALQRLEFDQKIVTPRFHHLHCHPFCFVSTPVKYSAIYWDMYLQTLMQNLASLQHKNQVNHVSQFSWIVIGQKNTAKNYPVSMLLWVRGLFITDPKTPNLDYVIHGCSLINH